MDTSFNTEQIEGNYREESLIQIPILRDEVHIPEEMGLDYDYVDPDMRSHNWLQ